MSTVSIGSHCSVNEINELHEIHLSHWLSHANPMELSHHDIDSVVDNIVQQLLIYDPEHLCLESIYYLD